MQTTFKKPCCWCQPDVYANVPVFISAGDDPSFKEKVRVLHVEDSGVSIEQVDEVTRFHVKILHPTFSAKGVLVRSGFPLKVHCDLLLYQAKAAFLTLHAYLVPWDSSVEKVISTYCSPLWLNNLSMLSMQIISVGKKIRHLIYSI